MTSVRVDLTDRSRNVYLDTSIYNCLLDDPDKDLILCAAKKRNLIIIPSVVNLCELLMTLDPIRKGNLIRIYNEIRNNFHPLKPFPWLLKESVECVERGVEYLEINYPINVSEETEKTCRDVMNKKGYGLDGYVQGARDYIQEVAKREKLADEHQYFAYVDSKGGEDVSLSLFDKICKGYDPAPDLDRETKLSIIRSPTLPWKHYLEAHYYFFYRRSFPEEKFGKNRNPGESDLEQCIYLFWASKFVARDGPLLDFLKRLNEIREYDKEIMDYQEFKSFLIE